MREIAISLILNSDDERVIRNYAQLHGKSVSDVVREAILEKIEDEFDLQEYDKAMKEHLKNPVTYTLAEIMEELGLD